MVHCQTPQLHKKAQPIASPHRTYPEKPEGTIVPGKSSSLPSYVSHLVQVSHKSINALMFPLPPTPHPHFQAPLPSIGETAADRERSYSAEVCLFQIRRNKNYYGSTSAETMVIMSKPVFIPGQA